MNKLIKSLGGLAAAVIVVASVTPAEAVVPSHSMARDLTWARARHLQATQRGAAIVHYAYLQKGKKIGNGQCTELIKEALIYSRSKPGNFADPKNYDWGLKKSPGTAIRTGNIIQFEDCTFVTTTTSANGGTSTSTQNMPHHTAIVYRATGSTVTLLHQNISGSPVQLTRLNLADLKSGRYTVWAAVAK